MAHNLYFLPITRRSVHGRVNASAMTLAKQYKPAYSSLRSFEIDAGTFRTDRYYLAEQSLAAAKAAEAIRISLTFAQNLTCLSLKFRRSIPSYSQAEPTMNASVMDILSAELHMPGLRHLQLANLIVNGFEICAIPLQTHH